MAHDNKIWFDLAWRVVQLYCPQLKDVRHITLNTCRSFLMLELATYWKLDMDMLKNEQVFYHVLKGHCCGEVMKEILAIFYYAFTDKTVAGEMPEIFIAIADKERNLPTPYYDRFVAQYKKEHSRPRGHAPLLVLSEPSLREFKHAHRGKWKMLKEMIKEIDRDERK